MDDPLPLASCASFHLSQPEAMEEIAWVWGQDAVMSEVKTNPLRIISVGKEVEDIFLVIMWTNILHVKG